MPTVAAPSQTARRDRLAEYGPADLRRGAARLAERCYKAADGDGYEALWLAIQYLRWRRERGFDC